MDQWEHSVDYIVSNNNDTRAKTIEKHAAYEYLCFDTNVSNLINNSVPVSNEVINRNANWLSSNYSNNSTYQPLTSFLVERLYNDYNCIVDSKAPYDYYFYYSWWTGVDSIKHSFAEDYYGKLPYTINTIYYDKNENNSSSEDINLDIFYNNDPILKKIGVPLSLGALGYEGYKAGKNMLNNY
jgi:hypothetical protein